MSFSKKEKISRTTGRPLEYYNQLLGLALEDYTNKSILNVGSGASDLKLMLEEHGVNPKSVVNVDFAYKNVETKTGVLDFITGKNLKREDTPQGAVAADIKSLPFADGSFDKVLGLWSVGWLNEAKIPDAVTESYRVCNEGGEVRIYPVFISKESLEIAKQYPFLRTERPSVDLGELMRAGESIISKIDYLSIEASARLRGGLLLGKPPSTLIILKNKDITLDMIKKAIQNLIENGATLF